MPAHQRLQWLREWLQHGCGGAGACRICSRLWAPARGWNVFLMFSTANFVFPAPSFVEIDDLLPRSHSTPAIIIHSYLSHSSSKNFFKLGLLQSGFCDSIVIHILAPRILSGNRASRCLIWYLWIKQSKASALRVAGSATCEFFNSGWPQIFILSSDRASRCLIWYLWI